MPLYLMVLDPARHSRLLRETGPVDTGVVAFCCAPVRRGYALQRDLLAAMGVRHDVRHGRSSTGAERNGTLLAAWLSAHQVTTVLACFADFAEPQYFADLARIVDNGGADLVMVTDDFEGALPRVTVNDPMDRGVRLSRWAAEAGAVTLAGDAADAYLAGRGRPWVPPDDPRAAFPQVLPSCDWTLWRDRCRQVLPPQEFKGVDDLYRSTFAQVIEADPTDQAGCGDLLADMLEPLRSAGEAVCVARALQAAMFTLGFLVTLKVSALAGSVDEGHQRALTPGDLRALRAYREPWVAVVTVMRRMGLEYVNIANTRLGNVTEDGRLRQKGLDRDVPEGARVFLRAQRTLRLTEGAQADDVLVDRPPRAVTEAIRWTTQDLNLPGIERRARAAGVHWLDRADLRVRRLDDDWKGVGLWATRSL